MNSLIDIIARWSPLGQWLFLLLIVLFTYGGLVGVFKYLAVMVRGWPPVHCVEYEEEDASVQ